MTPGWAATGPTLALPTASRLPDPDGGHGDDREPFQSWSSLIGIITAIVGNILIALALNVQRYAHTRLHKQRRRVRHRARAALKRAQSTGNTGSYGAIGADDAGNRTGNGTSNGGGNGRGNGSTASTVRGEVDQADETEPLTASFLSGATTEDGDGDDEDEDKVASTYLKSPYWWLGQILITLGEMGNFLAYGFAPASIVSPLGVVALVSNCIIAPAMFHERFRHRDFWGVISAVAGVVTVVLSANTEETKLDPHAVWDAITTIEFEVYLGVTILLILILMWASPKFGRRTILIDLGLVGLFGGYTALATKGVSSLLSATLWRAFTTPVTYVLLLILLGTAVMQIRYVNKALQRFNSTQVIPIQFVMFTLCVILGSAILYRDFEQTTGTQAGKFVGGCLLTFFGVFLITSGRQQPEEEEDVLSEADGVEETIGMAQQEGDADQVTSAAQSRRGSRLSRVSFAEGIKSRSPGSSSPPDAADRESAPLLGTSWRETWDNATEFPQGNRTLSTESVPISSAAASTQGLSNPATPMRDGLGQPVYPTDYSVIPRPGLSPIKPAVNHHHRSRTFISPSPLSSTVNAVVKDAFLRPEDNNPRQSSLRRIRSRIRASLFFSDDDDGSGAGAGESTRSAASQPAVPGSEDNITRSLSHQEPNTQDDPDAARRRARSVSDTLGSFFRPSRKKREVPPTDADVDDGAGTNSGGEAIR